FSYYQHMLSFYVIHDTSATDLYTLSLHDALPIYSTISFSASDRADSRSPEFQPGCPQQVCAAGTVTSYPAFSRSLSAANAIEGRMRSTRQVANRPTRMNSGKRVERVAPKS